MDSEIQDRVWGRATVTVIGIKCSQSDRPVIINSDWQLYDRGYCSFNSMTLPVSWFQHPDYWLSVLGLEAIECKYIKALSMKSLEILNPLTFTHKLVQFYCHVAVFIINRIK